MAARRFLGGAFVVIGVVIGTSAFAESPDEEECVEWTYPKESACGNLSGKTECKATPSIEASEDDDKKDKCKPTKGDTCFCE